MGLKNRPLNSPKVGHPYASVFDAWYYNTKIDGSRSRKQRNTTECSFELLKPIHEPYTMENLNNPIHAAAYRWFDINHRLEIWFCNFAVLCFFLNRDKHLHGTFMMEATPTGGSATAAYPKEFLTCNGFTISMRFPRYVPQLLKIQKQTCSLDFAYWVTDNAFWVAVSQFSIWTKSFAFRATCTKFVDITCKKLFSRVF